MPRASPGRTRSRTSSHPAGPRRLWRCKGAHHASAQARCGPNAPPSSPTLPPAWRLRLPRTLAHLRRPEPAAQLMGFAEAFYAERFGTLGREDLPEARRTRRLVAAQLGRAASAGHWRQSAGLAMPQPMRLGMAETAPAAPG